MARILVIEDNEDNLELMTYLLSAFGHAVATATDGEEALDIAAAQPFELIVCDVNLPKLDGVQVVGTLKAQPAYARVPIVAVTALAMVGDRERLLGAGFDGYVSKPIEPEDFLCQIDKLLSGTSTDDLWPESS